MHARAAVLLALALGHASATNCTTYPCSCDDEPGKCIVLGSFGEGGIANSGGVRPFISEEDCNPGMVVVASPSKADRDPVPVKCYGKDVTIEPSRLLYCPPL